MHRQPHNAPSAEAASLCQPSGGQPWTPGDQDQVPQEHFTTPADDTSPRDWSHLGRRVMAEAWRRLTDEHATRQSAQAAPVVPAPHDQEPPR